MKIFLRRFVTTLVACYTWQNVLWQLLAIALTYLIVMSGFDWWWFTHTQNPLLQSWLLPAIVVGGFLPFLLPAALFAAGKFKKNVRATLTAVAVTQAGIMGLLVSSFYKIFTGRIQPPLTVGNLVDTSREFLFGFLRHGVFWGWPSSHTTVAFSIAVTLFVLYRDRPRIQYLAIVVALYVGIGVSTNMHWFSEFVAGTIIGSIIGFAVGNAYLRYTEKI
jgi:membrane-associated phospholipid phosphatase